MVIMEASIHMAINKKPQLSPIVFEKLLRYVQFKVGFHHVYIHPQKDPKHKWLDLPFLSIDDAIAEVIKRWPTKWHSASNVAVGTNMSTEKQKMESVKWKV